MDIDDEIQKVQTLIIEINYSDYKNQLLQALFNNFGDKVLETLVHKIIPGKDNKDTVDLLD